jgi:hypothetical protein
LRSKRYNDALVPYRWSATDNQPTILALEYIEYIVEDEHGNLTVIDTRLTRIRRAPDSDTQRSAHPQRPRHREQETR